MNSHFIYHKSNNRINEALTEEPRRVVELREIIQTRGKTHVSQGVHIPQGRYSWSE